MNSKSESLRSFVNSLSDIQVRLFRNYLLFVSGRKNNKLLQLFDHFRNESHLLNEAVIMNKMYDNGKFLNSFRMLKSRLKSKLLDCLILENNLCADTDFSGIDLSVIRLTKKLAVVHYLTTNYNGERILLEVLNDLVSESERLQVYWVLVEALRIQSAYLGHRKSPKEFLKQNQRIEYLYLLIRQTREAFGVYCVALDRFVKRDTNDQQIIVQTDKDLLYIKSIYEKYKLNHTKFIYNHLNAMNHLYKGEYEKAKSISYFNFQFVKKEKAVYSKRRLGIINLSIIEAELNSGNYRKADELIKKNYRFFTPNSSIHSDISYCA